MARLAAYYQEEFQYAPIGYGTTRQKKVSVENGYFNGGPRLRALAASEPSLSPAYSYSPKTAVMTLKAKSQLPSNKIAHQSRMAIQRLQNMYESQECLNPYTVSQLENDSFDCESVYSHGGRNMREDAYVKHKICKRLSYDCYDSYPPSPEAYIPRQLERYHAPNSNQIRSVDTIHGESFPVEGGFIHPEELIMPPESFRSDSSHGRWQQWPWNMVDTRQNPALLSPPSPLDSGLSSQSITSSPSLDAEPLPAHPGQVQVYRADSHPMCSCSQVCPETSRVISSPGRYDSGRSSPGLYSVAALKSKKSSHSKSRKNLNSGIIYVENEFGDEYGRGQVRYGMLGLIGEPVPHPAAIAKVSRRKYYKPEYVPSEASYYYIEEDEEPLEKPSYRSSKPHKHKPNYPKPSVVITEASDKSNTSSSPEHGNSILSPEPESSTSTELSNSASKSSSSVSSSNNDLKNGHRRKSSKRTEKEILELEDMYKKCNLGDYDLFERAERRDLPTAHQTKSDQSAAPTLTRSKSDTFYEMLSHGNPYQIHQRAPPLRRAGIPDIIGDDMALRKHSKPVTTSNFNPTDNTITYMLCSSHFTPTVPAGRDILLLDNPDVEYDDLSYRKHYHGKKGKIVDPQPPFGIPLRPPPPQSVYNDYLHVVPTGGPKPLCHPRGNPDVVRDDMAFRTLRKDEAEMYYDATEAYKKKRG